MFVLHCETNGEKMSERVKRIVLDADKDIELCETDDGTLYYHYENDIEFCYIFDGTRWEVVSFDEALNLVSISINKNDENIKRVYGVNF